MSEAEARRPRDVLPFALIALMKGVVEREVSPTVWQGVIHCSSQVRDHVAVLGLELMLDEAEGFAYLRQGPDVDGEEPLPRLVPRRQLSYAVSLLLALLRRRLAEADARGGDTQLVLTRNEIHDLVRHFSRDSSNEAKQADKLNRDIDRIAELGFLRPIKRDGDTFEVRRILAAFVDAQWLSEFDQRLAAYAAHAQSKHDLAEDA
jgi:uncharacterized protein DUF4194